MSAGVLGRSLAGLPPTTGCVWVEPRRAAAATCSQGLLLLGHSRPQPTECTQRVSPHVSTKPEDTRFGTARWVSGKEHAPH